MYINSWNEEIVVKKTLENDFLEVIMAGITHPNSNYRIVHNVSNQFPYDYYVFEYVVSGKGYIETPNQRFTVNAGDFYFLNKSCYHIYYADAYCPYEKVFLVLRGNFVDSLVSNYRLNDSVYIKNNDVKGSIMTIINMLDRDLPVNYDQLSVKILELFQNAFPPPYQKKQVSTQVAETIKNYIDSHIAQKITLESISNDLHISKSHIERVFKDAYNQPPIEYAMHTKITHVASMLITTSYSASQISQRLGFSDEKYMSKCFKKIKGLTPKQYRNEMKAKKEFYI